MTYILEIWDFGQWDVLVGNTDETKITRVYDALVDAGVKPHNMKVSQSKE